MIQQQRIIGCLHALEEVEASAAAASAPEEQSRATDRSVTDSEDWLEDIRTTPNQTSSANTALQASS